MLYQRTKLNSLGQMVRLMLVFVILLATNVTVSAQSEVVGTYRFAEVLSGPNNGSKNWQQVIVFESSNANALRGEVKFRVRNRNKEWERYSCRWEFSKDISFLRTGDTFTVTLYNSLQEGSATDYVINPICTFGGAFSPLQLIPEKYGDQKFHGTSNRTEEVWAKDQWNGNSPNKIGVHAATLGIDEAVQHYPLSPLAAYMLTIRIKTTSPTVAWESEKVMYNIEYVFKLAQDSDNRTAATLTEAFSILGKWTFDGHPQKIRLDYEFFQNGTATHWIGNQVKYGTWSRKGGTFIIRWSFGPPTKENYVDTVTIKDQNNLVGKNNYGNPINWKRMQ